jgi:hypothetical protein
MLPPVDSDEVLLMFPTFGDGKDWPLTARQVDHWRGLYPRLDVLQECRMACAWVEANPTRRKTKRGMPKFLVGWLNRAQPKPGGYQRQAAPTMAVTMHWKDECDQLHGGRCGNVHYHTAKVESDREKAS